VTKEAGLAHSVPDPKFLSLVAAWGRDQADIMLGFVWAAYDAMRTNMPTVNSRDLERSITQLLEPRIRDAMTGDEPYYVQHGSFERETMAAPPAQPPAYDLAFVLRADERIMWPLEAKVLETPSRVAEYDRDVRQEFVTCRYAPFSNAGAMLAYLLSGSAEEALEAIQSKLGTVLGATPAFGGRAHRTSDHERKVPQNKSYPNRFRCYHLVLEFQELKRAKGIRKLLK